MDIKPFIDSIEKKAAESIKSEQGDYFDDNGLLVCGKCNTLKQTEIMLFGELRRPYCLCKCAVEKRDKEAAERRRREFEDQIKEFRQIGFPESDMQGWCFANDDNSNASVTQAMRNYVDHFDKLSSTAQGLLLYGTVGTGKTFAACEVANALIDKGYPVLVTNFARLTNTIQGLFEGKQDYIDSLSRFKLLVIDDLGAERKSEYMQEMVYNIIDSRYRAGLPLIVTTNLTIEELKKPDNIGNARIYDRVLERCFPIEVKGSSRRRKAVRDNYENIKDLLGL